MIVSGLEGRSVKCVIGVSDLQIVEGVRGVSLNMTLQVVELIYIAETGILILPTSAESGDKNPW